MTNTLYIVDVDIEALADSLSYEMEEVEYYDNEEGEG